jgi:hypothetical protein
MAAVRFPHLNLCDFSDVAKVQARWSEIQPIQPQLLSTRSRGARESRNIDGVAEECIHNQPKDRNPGPSGHSHNGELKVGATDFFTSRATTSK